MVKQDRRAGGGDDLLAGDPLGAGDADEAVAADVEDPEVGDHPVHAAERRRRERQPVDQLGGPIFRRMVLQHDQATGAGGQIHRAAHPGDEAAGDGPVGQVAVAGDLQPSKNRQVDVPAADHAERQRRVEHAGAGERGDRLLAGVDEASVDLVLVRVGAHAEQAVLRLQRHVGRRVDVVRHLGRHPDPQVDDLPGHHLGGGAPDHLLTRPAHARTILVSVALTRAPFACASRR